MYGVNVNVALAINVKGKCLNFLQFIFGNSLISHTSTQNQISEQWVAEKSKIIFIGRAGQGVHWNLDSWADSL